MPVAEAAKRNKIAVPFYQTHPGVIPIRISDS